MADRLHQLLDEIVAIGKRQGKNQKELARAAGMDEATLSRAKKRGDMYYSSLESLCSAIGMRITLVPDNTVADKVRKGELFE